MSRIINEPRVTVRQSFGDFFREMNGESPVLLSMPKTDGNVYVLKRKSPRLRVDLRVRHDPFSRPAPGATLAFKDSFERCRITQAFCVARSQHQHFQK